MRPALFLDRDGVVNEELGFLSRPDQVRFVPGIFELTRAAQDRGYRLVIVTNQSGIGRGLYSEAEFRALMTWMSAEFAERGVTIDGVYFCPHHPEHGIGDYQRDCDCRKPGPGMLLKAARDHGIDLARSILIGDRFTDIQAGRAAGLERLFLFGMTEGEWPGADGRPRRITTFAEVLASL